MRAVDDDTMLRSPWWDDLDWGAELKSVGTIYRLMHYMPTEHCTGTVPTLYTAREAALHHGSHTRVSTHTRQPACWSEPAKHSDLRKNMNEVVIKGPQALTIHTHFP